MPDHPEQKHTVDWLYRILGSTRESLVISDPRRPDNPIIYANDAFYDLVGYGPEDVLGRNCRFLQGPGSNPDAIQILKRAIAAGEPCAVDLLNYRKDGSEFWNHLSINPVFDDEGELINFVGVQYDIGVRLRLELDREAARKSAEEANRAKSRFIATISHEIRTPLNVIVGFAERLMEDEARRLPDEVATRLRHIHDAGQILSGLVTDVLMWTRMEADAGRPAVTRFDLSAWLENIRVIFAEETRRLGIELRFTRLPGGPVEVETDRVKLSQIVINLVQNALKFTPEGGRVEVETAPAAPGFFALTVRDTGRGIPADQLETIFQAFRQVREDDAAGGKGIGLGLSITRNLVDLLWGRLEVNSREGVGSEFIVSLPRVFPASNAPAPPREVRPVRLLFLDDDILTRELMRALFARLELSAIIFGSPEELLRSAAARRPDLVLMDRRLGAVDGIEVARSLRDLPGCQDVPIVMISGDPPSAETREASDRHSARLIAEHLTKPVSLSDVRDLVRRFA